MSARATLGAMVAGSVLVVAVATCGKRDPDPPPPAPPPPPAKPAEEPWLGKEASAQIVGEHAMPGPLFDGLELGGPVPSADARAKIAAFGRANHVDLQLDVAADKLVAIRVDVSYGGCCGYEGADALGLRLGRPETYDSCLDCRPTGWENDWTLDDGRRLMTASIRVNRVRIRWEPVLADAALLERADALIGQDYEAAGKAAGDRWHEMIFERAYLLEAPYPLAPIAGDTPSGIPLASRRNIGLWITVERRKIVAVAFNLRGDNDGEVERRYAAAIKRWGRPRDDEYGVVWRRPDRTITACCKGGLRNVTIKGI